jgi:hypothetical protein
MEDTMKATIVSALLATLLLAPAGWTQTNKVENFVTVQPAGQWLASQFIGQPVTNNAGERVGDVNDLLFDKSGQVSTVVIGVGGFLGVGEKMWRFRSGPCPSRPIPMVSA